MHFVYKNRLLYFFLYRHTNPIESLQLFFETYHLEVNNPKFKGKILKILYEKKLKHILDIQLLQKRPIILF